MADGNPYTEVESEKPVLEKLGYQLAPIGGAIGYVLVSAANGVGWVFKGIASAITNTLGAIKDGLVWCFSENRPLFAFAFLCILTISCALAFVNTYGAWLRTGDVGYTVLIGGIEGILLVALPLAFIVRGWFNTTGAVIIFVAGLVIASFNAKPALEEILTKGQMVNAAGARHQAQKLDEEVFGFIDPETGARIEGSGLLHQAKRLEEDASKNRLEKGHTTASVTVDKQAGVLRTQISEKLAKAESLRAAADKAVFIAMLATLTFIVAELIRSFGMKTLLGIGRSSTGRTKKVVIDGKEYDPDWLAKAAEHRANYEFGQSTKDLMKMIGNTEWSKEKRTSIWAMHKAGASMAEIAEAHGWELGEFEGILEKLFKRAQIDAIKAGGSADAAA